MRRGLPGQVGAQTRRKRSRQARLRWSDSGKAAAVPEEAGGEGDDQKAEAGAEVEREVGAVAGLGVGGLGRGGCRIGERRRGASNRLPALVATVCAAGAGGGAAAAGRAPLI